MLSWSQVLSVLILSSRVIIRWFCITFYANALVSRLILAEITGIHHLISLYKIHSSHLTMLYCDIALQTSFRCYIANITLIFALVLPHKVLYIVVWKHGLYESMVFQCRNNQAIVTPICKAEEGFRQLKHYDRKIKIFENTALLWVFANQDNTVWLSVCAHMPVLMHLKMEDGLNDI